LEANPEYQVEWMHEKTTAYRINDSQPCSSWWF
jgi:hypothetical protein